MKTLLLYLFLFFVPFLRSNFAQSAVALLECQKAQTAKETLIYLHGFDTEPPNSQEQENREILKRIAKKTNLNLAIMRSSYTCTGNKRCWPQDDRDVFEKVLREIETAATPCQVPGSKYILLGFSNGGYFGSKTSRYCRPGPNLVISIGSAGVLDSNDKVDAATLPSCPKLIQMIGSKDLSHSKAKAFVKSMRDKGRNATLVEYQGGHVLPENDLLKLLKSD